jgi:PPK2 family polyphosphate:nucleotide phosphotransferase
MDMPQRGKMAMDRYRVPQGRPVRLDRWDPHDKSSFRGGKSAGKRLLEKLALRMDKAQELLYAGQSRSLLVVLQGMDTSGKDGTIRHVFKSIDPQGVLVAAFKKPTEEESRHDFLWRIEKQVPRPGEIVLFNRSHYEDVVTVRVHGLAPEEVWSKRFDAINDFERRLAEGGTVILKFFLHIGLEEQKERLQDRLDDPSKQWKFNPEDLQDRKLWPDYMKAYEDVLNRTSTAWAPWYIIPADRKWYRNLLVSSIVVSALERLGLNYPKLPYDPKKARIE